jgi:hypothetical protein
MNTTRFSITPEVLRQQHPIIIWQSYPVEEVAKIAAGCAAGTPQDRILEALKLLAAAEEIAIWTPWTDQHLRRKEGDGLGDIPDLEKVDVLFDLQQQADEIIKLATDAEGRINRVNLCKIACDKAGRKSPKTKDEPEEKPLSDDRTEKLFRNGWLPQAAEDHARWKLFRQMEQDAHRERKELRSAIEQGLSKKVINNLREKVAATEAISFQSGGRFYPAAEEIYRRREALTEQERETEREGFRLSLEQGKRGQPRIIHTEELARDILVGTRDFAGFLEFVRFPEEKPKYVSTLPQARDGGGAFVKLERGADGKKKEICDGSHVDELPVHGLSESPVESTKTTHWRKKTQQ